MKGRGRDAAAAVALVAGLAVCCGVHLVAAAGGLAAIGVLLAGWWGAAALTVAALLVGAGIARLRRRGQS